MTAMTETPAPVTETWAYAGQRLTRQHRLATLWIDNAGAGTELWFTRKTRHVIGGLYEVTVTRHDNDGLSRHGDAIYTGKQLPPDDERVRRWTTHHHAAHVRHQQIRAEANAAKRDAIDHALQPLRELVATCRTRDERDALLATILRRLTDK
jgi:hypothetical protein